MSNVNKAWLNKWLADVKDVKTWTASKNQLNPGETFEILLKKLVAGEDVYPDDYLKGNVYGKGNPVPAILLVVNSTGKHQSYPGRVVGILKVTGWKKVKKDGKNETHLVLDKQAFYIEGEYAVHYEAKKTWGTNLKPSRSYDEFLYGNPQSNIEREEKLKEFINHNLKAYLRNDHCHLINEKGRVERDDSQHLLNSRQLIFYGPPGTGKTRRAKIEAVRIVKNDPYFSEENALHIFSANASADETEDTDRKQIRKQIRIVQFHPGYSYNDFMETIDMTRKGYADRIFKEFADQARQDKEKPYVLIIDEINRANVSEVLGELLYGIEYRGASITTEVSGKSFSVPENLYIIGTMNTADRSLQNLDYAVRRRFTFEKLKSEEPETICDGKEYFLKNAFETVREDVKTSVARGIDPEDIMPGISYFMVNADEDGYDSEHFAYKMKYELIPLLKEYVKDGMFTMRKKIDKDNNLSLTELLQKEQYFDRIENSLKVKCEE